MEFQGFEDHEEEYRPCDDNNTNGLMLQPVIPGTNLPIQTEVVVVSEQSPEDVIMFRDPELENLPRSAPDATTFTENFYETEPEKTRVVDVEPTVLIGPPLGLEEDPHSPKPHPEKIPPSNYQTKVTDPTGEGGTEVEVGPLLERLGDFHIHEQSPPTADQVVEDKVAEGDVSSNKKPVTELATEYGHKAAEMLAPVYGKVVGAGSAVLSKIGSEKGASTVREYLEEKLRPGEDDKALSEAIFGRFRKKEEVVVVQQVGAGDERSLGVMERLKGAVGSSWIGKSTVGVGSAEHNIKDKEHQG